MTFSLHTDFRDAKELSRCLCLPSSQSIQWLENAWMDVWGVHCETFVWKVLRETREVGVDSGAMQPTRCHPHR